MKKLLAFDLDDTLAVSKTAITDEIAGLLGGVLEHFDVCIISGGKYGQFEKQVIQRLNLTPVQMRRLHLMPTCGTRYYQHDEMKDEWVLQYAEDLSEGQKKKIIAALEESSKTLGLWEENPAGPIIEDRESQITFSALGQKAKPELKKAWDPTGDKKRALRDATAALLPEFEVRAGGSTSVDVTLPGIDKAYGMQRLIDMLDLSRDDILFFGDNLQEGGNDYPVKAMGIDCLDVGEWEDTAHRLESILAVL